MNIDRYSPFEELASHLLRTLDQSGDGAHDYAHLERVWRNANAIHADEGGDLELLAAAVMLHDCVHVPKNSPDRSRASRLASERARGVLRSLRWVAARIDVVAGAIESHSYSAAIEPMSIEGRILQDADRLDAIGFMGIARCFYTAGRMGSSLYEPSDPRGESRELNDASFALDHFPKKLLRLAGGFKTRAGQNLAKDRQKILEHFYTGMLAEIS